MEVTSNNRNPERSLGESNNRQSERFSQSNRNLTRSFTIVLYNNIWDTEYIFKQRLVWNFSIRTMGAQHIRQSGGLAVPFENEK